MRVAVVSAGKGVRGILAVLAPQAKEGEAVPQFQVTVATTATLDTVTELLRAAALPADGIEQLGETLWVARDGDEIAGCVALEIHGDDALLRSLCVAPERRGAGVGDLLVRVAVEQAAARRLRGLYLLTTTAADYFPRHGFRRIARVAVPAAVRGSAEFTGLCPESAVVMARQVLP